jgi:hypothetical protein
MRKGTTPQANTLRFTDGDRSGYGLFAQDWTGVSSPALLRALQSIMPATQGPGTSEAGQAETVTVGQGR